LIYSGFCDDFFTLETREKSTVMVRGNAYETLCTALPALRHD
jgi:hypothetical protein